MMFLCYARIGISESVAVEEEIIVYLGTVRVLKIKI